MPLALDFQGVLAGLDRVALQDQLVVEAEQVGGVDLDLLVLLAVEPDFDGHVRASSPLAFR